MAGEPPGTTPGTTPSETDVGESRGLDLDALGRYLEARIPGFRGPVAARRFLGGQSNPTYHLTAGSGAYVLRRKPPGQLLPSAHAVEREYRILTALAGTGVPVPRTHLLCEDPSVVGTPFYVMEYVPGRVVTNPSMPGESPATRAAVYDAMNDVLARLHGVDWRALGLADFGRPGSYFARQIHRWTSQYRASETSPIAAMERLIAWLPAHVPPDDETTVVHGDYRLGNMLLHPTEPRVVAILDWELSTLGHPLADLAYHCLPYHLRPEEFDGFLGADLGSLGIPTEAACLAAYCRRTGRASLPGWSFYVAFAMFRLAAISQGIMGRVRDGTANDPNARERGLRARPLAEAAWGVAAGGVGCGVAS